MKQISQIVLVTALAACLVIAVGEGEEQWTINPAGLYDVCPAFTRVMPSHFFFLFPDFGGESRIDECAPDRAQWRFQAGRILSRSMTPQFVASELKYHLRCLEHFGKLKNGARFYSVVNGSLANAADLIEETLCVS